MTHNHAEYSSSTLAFIFEAADTVRVIFIHHFDFGLYSLP